MHVVNRLAGQSQSATRICRPGAIGRLARHGGGGFKTIFDGQNRNTDTGGRWNIDSNLMTVGMTRRGLEVMRMVQRCDDCHDAVSRLSRTASENAAADTTYSDEASLEKLERDLQVLVASTQLTDSDRTRLKRVMTDILDWLVPTPPTPSRIQVGASEPRPAEPVRLEPEP